MIKWQGTAEFGAGEDGRFGCFDEFEELLSGLERILEIVTVVNRNDLPLTRAHQYL